MRWPRLRLSGATLAVAIVMLAVGGALAGTVSALASSTLRRNKNSADAITGFRRRALSIAESIASRSAAG